MRATSRRPVVLTQVQVQIGDPAGMRRVCDQRRRSECGIRLGQRQRRGIDHDRTHPLGEQLRGAAITVAVRVDERGGLGEHGPRAPERGIRPCRGAPG